VSAAINLNDCDIRVLNTIVKGRKDGPWNMTHKIENEFNVYTLDGTMLISWQ